MIGRRGYLPGVSVIRQNNTTKDILKNRYSLLLIGSTLTALIFLHYRVVTKMALEILGFDYDGFDYDGW